MFTKPISRSRTLAAAVLFLTMGGVLSAQTAFARITANTMNPVALVTDGGRHVLVTGPVACTAGERLHLRVTVTQRSTGAVAEGRTLATCTGDTQLWEVHASALGPASFEAGPATATALGRTVDHGTSTDANQWLVGLTLEAE